MSEHRDCESRDLCDDVRERLAAAEKRLTEINSIALAIRATPLVDIGKLLGQVERIETISRPVWSPTD